MFLICARSSARADFVCVVASIEDFRRARLEHSMALADLFPPEQRNKVNIIAFGVVFVVAGIIVLVTILNGQKGERGD